MSQQKNPTSLFLIMVVAAIVIFLLDNAGFLLKGREVFEQLVSGVGKNANTIHSDQVEIDEEQLEQKLVELERLKKENEDLRLQLGIGKQTQQMVLGQVISTTRAFVINVGSDDGVRNGNTAVFKNIYVGKIEKTSKKTSRVLLPNENESIIKVQTVKTGAKGLLRGTGDVIELTEVLLSDELRQGDTLVTIGDVDEGGLGVRPGLLIGKISQIRKSNDEIFAQATVEPLIDYTLLQNVFIVL